MRERAMIRAAAGWILRDTGGLLAHECRLSVGVGRADGLALTDGPGGAPLVHALEAKSPSALMQLLPLRLGWYSDDAAGGVVGDVATPDPAWQPEQREAIGALAPLHVPALAQLARYPGDTAWLVSAQGALDEVPQLAATLARVCEATGVGWIEVDWYGQVTPRLEAARRPPRPFVGDPLELYARGAALRQAMQQASQDGALPRSTERIAPISDKPCACP